MGKFNRLSVSDVISLVLLPLGVDLTLCGVDDPSLGVLDLFDPGVKVIGLLVPGVL